MLPARTTSAPYPWVAETFAIGAERGLYTGSGCRKGNALCMVARRGRNNSVQVALSEALHNLIVSTAHLKGAGLLLVFVLQINLCAGHGGEGAGRRQRNVVDDVFQSAAASKSFNSNIEHLPRFCKLR